MLKSEKVIRSKLEGKKLQQFRNSRVEKRETYLVSNPTSCDPHGGLQVVLLRNCFHNGENFLFGFIQSDATLVCELFLHFFPILFLGNIFNFRIEGKFMLFGEKTVQSFCVKIGDSYFFSLLFFFLRIFQFFGEFHYFLFCLLNEKKERK